MHPHIRLLRSDDIDPIADAFAALGWNKPATQYERYLAQQDAGERLVLVGFVHQAFAGYVTIAWLSEYTPFSVEQIPEIQDFNVLPQYRRRGIGTALMDEAERRIAERSDIAASESACTRIMAQHSGCMPGVAMCPMAGESCMTIRPLRPARR